MLFLHLATIPCQPLLGCRNYIWQYDCYDQDRPIIRIKLKNDPLVSTARIVKRELGMPSALVYSPEVYLEKYDQIKGRLELLARERADLANTGFENNRLENYDFYLDTTRMCPEELYCTLTGKFDWTDQITDWEFSYLSVKVNELDQIISDISDDSELDNLKNILEKEIYKLYNTDSLNIEEQRRVIRDYLKIITNKLKEKLPSFYYNKNLDQLELFDRKTKRFSDQTRINHHPITPLPHAIDNILLDGIPSWYK